MILGISISLIVTTLLLFILVLSLYARHYADRDARMLSSLAKQYGGKILVDSFNSSAMIDFSHRGAKIRFYQRKRGGGKITRYFLRCEVNYSNPLQVHIAREVSGESSISGLTHFMFVPKLEVGSKNFTREFAVHGNDQSFLQALLNSDIQKQLLAFISKDPVIYLHPKKEAVARIKGAPVPGHVLEISLNQVSDRKDELSAVIGESLSLVGRFLSARSL